MNHGFSGRTQRLREAGPGEGACGRGEALACEPGHLLDGTTNRGPAVSVKGQGDRLVGDLPALAFCALVPMSPTSGLVDWTLFLQKSLRLETSLMHRSPSPHTGTSSKWECEPVCTFQAFLSLQLQCCCMGFLQGRGLPV